MITRVFHRDPTSLLNNYVLRTTAAFYGGFLETWFPHLVGCDHVRLHLSHRKFKRAKRVPHVASKYNRAGHRFVLRHFGNVDHLYVVAESADPSFKQEAR